MGSVVAKLVQSEFNKTLLWSTLHGMKQGKQDLLAGVEGHRGELLTNQSRFFVVP